MAQLRLASVALGACLLALLACKSGDKKEESSGPSVKVEAKGNSAGVTVGGKDGVQLGASSGECKPGEPCKCSGIGACNKKCAGSGCTFECDGIGACNFECPEGKCTVKSSATGAVNLKCEGGGCKLTCSGAGACNIDECESGCSTDCTGPGTCTCKSGC